MWGLEELPALPRFLPLCLHIHHHPWSTHLTGWKLMQRIEAVSLPQNTMALGLCRVAASIAPNSPLSPTPWLLRDPDDVRGSACQESSVTKHTACALDSTLDRGALPGGHLSFLSHGSNGV